MATSAVSPLYIDSIALAATGSTHPVPVVGMITNSSAEGAGALKLTEQDRHPVSWCPLSGGRRRCGSVPSADVRSGAPDLGMRAGGDKIAALKLSESRRRHEPDHLIFRLRRPPDPRARHCSSAGNIAPAPAMNPRNTADERHDQDDDNGGADEHGHLVVDVPLSNHDAPTA